MGQSIQIRRGNKSNLPSLKSGELGLTLDTQQTYVGTPVGNVEFLMGFTATTAGASNAYTVALPTSLSSYWNGLTIRLQIHADATGNPTLAINGLTAKPLKKANGNAANNLKKDGIYTFVYSSTTGNFILQGEGGSGNAQNSDVLAGKTFSNDGGDSVGTMVNNGAITITPNDVSQTIPAGYHDGTGKVEAVPLTYKKFKSGTVFINNDLYTFGTQYISEMNQYAAIVNGLTFKPRLILVQHLGSGSYTLYNADLSNGYVYLLDQSAGAYMTGYSITDTGFMLPFSGSFLTVTWYAFG